MYIFHFHVTFCQFLSFVLTDITMHNVSVMTLLDGLGTYAKYCILLFALNLPDRIVDPFNCEFMGSVLVSPSVIL